MCLRVKFKELVWSTCHGRPLNVASFGLGDVPKRPVDVSIQNFKVLATSRKSEIDMQYKDYFFQNTILSLNHQLLYWSPAVHVNIPCRFRPLGASGDVPGRFSLKLILHFLDQVYPQFLVFYIFLYQLKHLHHLFFYYLLL